MKQRRIIRLLAFVGVLALVGAACSSNDNNTPAGNSGSTGATGGGVDCSTVEFGCVEVASGAPIKIGTLLAIKRPGVGGLIIDWLALYAQDATGYDNLCALVSAAHLARPVHEDAHIPIDKLDGRTDGLIALTAATAQSLALEDAARLMALLTMALADTTVVTVTTKFTYRHWRPGNAIPQADTDGNPATTADPTWTPLIVTPNHPDYLSGHTTVSGAVTTALTALTGTSRIDLNMPSPANAAVPTRHYEWAGELNADSIGARIWAGIHTRTADEVGNRVGKKVGAFGMSHYFAATS